MKSISFQLHFAATCLTCKEVEFALIIQQQHVENLKALALLILYFVLCGCIIYHRTDDGRIQKRKQAQTKGEGA